MQRNEHNWPLITVIGDPLCNCTVADRLDGPQPPGYFRHACASLPERADRPELARDPFASAQAQADILDRRALHEADAGPPCHALFSRQGRRFNESRYDPRWRISRNKANKPDNTDAAQRS